MRLVFDALLHNSLENEIIFNLIGFPSVLRDQRALGKWGFGNALRKVEVCQKAPLVTVS